MQDEVREATKYIVTIEEFDSENKDEALFITTSFQSDKHLTVEYIQNLKKAIDRLLDHQMKAHYNKEKDNEKLHKKND